MAKEDPWCKAEVEAVAATAATVAPRVAKAARVAAVAAGFFSGVGRRGGDSVLSRFTFRIFYRNVTYIATPLTYIASVYSRNLYTRLQARPLVSHNEDLGCLAA